MTHPQYGEPDEIQPPSGRGRLFQYHDVAAPGVLPRDVFVWQPDGYPPPDGYDLLCLQDGQNLFDSRRVPLGIAWEADGTLARLIDASRVRPALIVGIACTAQRFRDYAPAMVIDRLPASARAAVAAEWGGPTLSADYARLVVERVLPLVAARFPVSRDPRRTIIGGASLGGAVALEIAARYPQRFGAVAALSAHTSLLPVTEREPIPPGFAASVVEAVGAFAARDLPPAGLHRLWIDRSGRAIDRFYPPSHAALTGALDARGYRAGRDYMHRVYPDAGHDEAAWRDRLGDALCFLLG